MFDRTVRVTRGELHAQHHGRPPGGSHHRIGLALFLPIFMAVLPAAGLDATDVDDPLRLGSFARDHFGFFALPYVDGLALHVAGIVAVLAVAQRLGRRSPWIAVATIAGLGWMVLDIAQNGAGLYAAHEIVRHARRMRGRSSCWSAAS